MALGQVCYLLLAHWTGIMRLGCYLGIHSWSCFWKQPSIDRLGLNPGSVSKAHSLKSHCSRKLSHLLTFVHCSSLVWAPFFKKKKQKTLYRTIILQTEKCSCSACCVFTAPAPRSTNSSLPACHNLFVSPSGDDTLKITGRKACNQSFVGMWKRHYGRERIAVVPSLIHSLAFGGFNYLWSAAVRIY